MNTRNDSTNGDSLHGESPDRRTARRANSSHPRNVRGIGLIEVMVAVVVLAFGMLAIAAMQATALRNSQSSLERSQAVVQTYAILDAMRANRDVANIGGYNIGVISDAGVVTSWICNPPDTGTLATNDLNEWIESMQGTAGPPVVRPALSATACVAIDCGSLQCTIAVQWNDARGSGGDSAQELITSTRI